MSFFICRNNTKLLKNRTDYSLRLRRTWSKKNKGLHPYGKIILFCSCALNLPVTRGNQHGDTGCQHQDLIFAKDEQGLFILSLLNEQTGPKDMQNSFGIVPTTYVTASGNKVSALMALTLGTLQLIHFCHASSSPRVTWPQGTMHPLDHLWFMNCKSKERERQLD